MGINVNMKTEVKNSKKIIRDKNLFNLVMIYGTVAVGKFTVANELQKITGYKFLHNHHTHDLVRLFMESDSPDFHRIIENLRYFLFKEISKSKINVITTLAFIPSFISKTGITDSIYIKKIESIVKKFGGRVCYVHLIADRDTILRRVTGNSRKKFRKN